jgi:Planctomycete cytochrome C
LEQPCEELGKPLNPHSSAESSQYNGPMRIPLCLVACTLQLVSLPLMAKVDFIREVKPILELRCVRCHDSVTAMKHLRLDRKDRAMLVIVPKKPEDSRLFLAARSEFMPPGGPKLSAAELDTLRRWIAEGARWPKNLELVGRNPFETSR